MMALSCPPGGQAQLVVVVVVAPSMAQVLPLVLHGLGTRPRQVAVQGTMASRAALGVAQEQVEPRQQAVAVAVVAMQPLTLLWHASLVPFDERAR